MCALGYNRAMAGTLSLKCSCGALKGVARDVSPSTGTRVVCLCDDCQAYARQLGREGDVLDAHGGTDIFQTTPAQIAITDGAEHLGCLRLTKNGLMRWHATCCNTPVANTLASAKFPFAGVVHTFMDLPADSASREAVLGPVRAKVQAQYSANPPADAYDKVPFWMYFRVARLLLRGWLKGLHTPSPFFDAKTGEPSVTPFVVRQRRKDEAAEG